jgi:hypothetical protein
MLELLFIHILVVGAQVLIWHEGDYPAEVVLPIFAVINWTLAVALIVGWATFMGHLSPQRRAKRAVLTQELGAVYYEQPLGET